MRSRMVFSIPIIRAEVMTNSPQGSLPQTPPGAAHPLADLRLDGVFDLLTISMAKLPCAFNRKCIPNQDMKLALSGSKRLLISWSVSSCCGWAKPLQPGPLVSHWAKIDALE